ncbi:MAG: hypothetical protein WCP45_16575 [Verrucomicrobiota bacterium]
MAFVENMAKMEASFPRRIVWVRFACHGTAHLTGKTIPIQNKRPEFFRDTSLECRLWLDAFQKILAGPQVISVIVGENLITFLIPQLPDTARPFTLSSHAP